MLELIRAKPWATEYLLFVTFRTRKALFVYLSNMQKPGGCFHNVGNLPLCSWI
jgi:hypothetical protein